MFEKLRIERERNPSWVPFPLSSFPVSFRFSVYLQSDPARVSPAVFLCPDLFYLLGGKGGRFVSMSANSVMISGIRMLWGQMEAQAPQPTQRRGSRDGSALSGS